MMVEYSELVNGVSIHVSNCPERAIVDALRHVVRDFCKRTKAWVYDNPALVIEEGKLEYALTLPTDSAVFHLWGLDGRNGSYAALQNVYLSSPDKLIFTKQPSSSKSIKPLLSLIPSVKSTEFPSHIRETYEEYLISGAVAYLQVQPFREWSLPNASQVHQNKYEQGIIEAKRLRDEGLGISRARSRVRAQYI